MKLSLAALFSVLVALVQAPAFAEDHVYLDKSNFNKLIKVKDQLIIVEVTADWCGWCKKLQAETFPEVRKAYKGIKIYYIDYDKQPQEWIAAKHITISLPGVTLIRNGEVLARKHGYMPWDRFSLWMKNGLNGIGEYEPEEKADTKKIAFEK